MGVESTKCEAHHQERRRGCKSKAVRATKPLFKRVLLNNPPQATQLSRPSVSHAHMAREPDSWDLLLPPENEKEKKGGEPTTPHNRSRCRTRKLRRSWRSLAGHAQRHQTAQRGSRQDARTWHSTILGLLGAGHAARHCRPCISKSLGKTVLSTWNVRSHPEENKRGKKRVSDDWSALAYAARLSTYTNVDEILQTQCLLRPLLSRVQIIFIN